MNANHFFRIHHAQRLRRTAPGRVRSNVVVRAAEMGVAQGADEGTMMAKLCPAPEPQDRDCGVAPRQVRALFQAGYEAARTRRSRVSWAGCSVATRRWIRRSAGAFRPVTLDRWPRCTLRHYCTPIDHGRCPPAP